MSTWDVEPTSGIQGDLEELRERERKMHDDRERERERERKMHDDRERERERERCMMTEKEREGEKDAWWHIPRNTIIVIDRPASIWDIDAYS